MTYKDEMEALLTNSVGMFSRVTCTVYWDLFRKYECTPSEYQKTLKEALDDLDLNFT